MGRERPWGHIMALYDPASAVRNRPGGATYIKNREQVLSTSSPSSRLKKKV